MHEMSKLIFWENLKTILTQCLIKITSIPSVNPFTLLTKTDTLQIMS